MVKTDKNLVRFTNAFDRLTTQVQTHIDAIPLATANGTIDTWERDKGDLKARLWQLQKQLDQYADDIDLKEISSRVGNLLARLNTASYGISTPSPAPSAATPAISLPPIPIPKFDGAAHQWASFTSEFTDMVGNAATSDSTKIKLLEAALSGPARAVIENIVHGSTTFAAVWQLLVAEYDNKRDLAYAQAQRILNLPTGNNPADLTTIVHTTRAGIRGLQQMNANIADVLTNSIILAKLTPAVRAAWNHHTISTATEIPTTEALLQFLQEYSKTMAPPTKGSLQKPQPSSSGPPTSRQCSECAGSHPLKNCPAFKSASVDERIARVKKLNLCPNCFGSHAQKDCTSRFTCWECHKKHHTLLHKPSAAKDVSAATTAVASTVLLATAKVKINQQEVRAFIDSGSQVNMITHHAATKLKLPIRSTSGRTDLIQAGSSRQSVSNETQCVIHSTTEPFSLAIQPLVMESLVDNLPTVPVKVTDLQPLIRGKILADPTFHQPGQVDILLGADTYAKICTNAPRDIWGGVTAEHTRLGTILMGTATVQAPIATKNQVAASALTHFSKFWEIEDLPTTPILTADEAKALDFTVNSTRQLPNGRYEVRLPLASDPPNLGASRHIAIRRHVSLEKKFQRDPQFAHQYHAAVADYLAQGHMEPIPQDIPNTRVYYMPHHAVVRDSSATTKLRVVFDASAKTTSGFSLNDVQLCGPRLQPDIFPLLVRFRSHRIALSADIKQMYRQVSVAPADRDLQRVIYRSSPNEPFREYRMTTVTFGQKAAPFLAVFALQTAADLSPDPHTAAVIKSDFYVDDLLTGADSVETAIALKTQITKTLESAGFVTHKWTSSHRDVRDASSTPQVAVQDDTSSALGIAWNTGGDTFTVRVNNPTNQHWTRRSVLSMTNGLFDPLGWLSPTTITAKILLQKIIFSTKQWDEPLSHDISSHWAAWLDHLADLNKLRIPRFLFTAYASSRALIVFSDASEKAYAACVYVRNAAPEGVVIRLIAAKTKVAPLKPITLARLELLGALLATRLTDNVIKALNGSAMPVHAYSDSTIALAWIKSHPSRWNTFVANRTAEIQTILPGTAWQHVRSHDNPADLATRGVPPSELLNSSLWWNGPPWLMSSTNSGSNPGLERAPEARRIAIVAAVASIPVPIQDLLNRFSKLSKLRNTLAYVTYFCRRFILRQQTTALNADNYHQADQLLFKWLQSISYNSEIAAVQLKKPVPLSSSLASLNPFLDENGLLRVGGRLKNAQLPYDTRHPIILPSKHHVTTLIIRDYHINHAHAGPTTIHAIIREKYWFPAMQSRIKTLLRKCVICTRIKAKTAHQLMADLPTSRVTPVARPFLRTGVDLAGPFNLKTKLARSSRTYKGYIVLFICLNTKAIHLELATDLSTPAFFAAFTRFTSRRGLPQHIYSDNGTNFHGANNLMMSVSEKTASQGITWHFIPPSAPHFGGLWEAGVKSTKAHLRRVTGNTTLTFEECSTLLCRVEAVLNSRPLTPLSADPEDCGALTPAHFLIMGELESPPEEDFSTSSTHTLRRWQLIQKMSQDLWARWSAEYLTRLQNRPKWWRQQPSISIGRLVLIADANQPPLQWRLGRVTATHPGSDGQVRVATVKTHHGSVQRPLTKLCLLPYDDF